MVWKRYRCFVLDLLSGYQLVRFHELLKVFGPLFQHRFQDRQVRLLFDLRFQGQTHCVLQEVPHDMQHRVAQAFLLSQQDVSRFVDR